MEKFLRLFTNKYFKNISFLSAERLFRGLSNFLIFAAIGRALGAEDFGKYNTMLAYTAIFGSFSKMGLSNILVREFVKNIKHSAKTIFFNGIIIKLGISVIIIISLYTYIFFFQNEIDEVQTLLLIGIWILLFDQFDIFEFYFEANVNGKKIATVRFIHQVVLISMKLLILTFFPGLEILVYLLVFDSVIFALLYFTAGRKNINLDYKIEVQTIKSLIKSSLPLLLSSLMVSLYMRIDQVMLENFKGPLDVGLYSVSVKFSESVNLIPIIFLSTFFPSMVFNGEKNIETLEKITINLYSTLIIIALFFVGLFWIGSEYITELFYGNAYLESANYSKVLMISVIFVFLGTVSTKWHLAMNLERNIFFYTATGGIINLLMNYFLIPKYSINGAIISSIISYFFASTVSNIFLKGSRRNLFLQIKAIQNIISLKYER